MKKLFYTFVVASVMLCACKNNNGDIQTPVQKENMTFKCSAEQGKQRTTVGKDGVTVLWTKDDAIKVYTNSDADGSTLNLTKGEESSFAEFDGLCAIDAPWYAIYPASVTPAEGGCKNGVISFKLSDTQYYKAGSFTTNTMPSVAFSATPENLLFRHTCGVLLLSLTGDAKVKSITLTDNNGFKLCGTFTAAPSESAAAHYSGTDGKSYITLNCGEGVSLDESKPTEFWFVVPEGAFKNGFSAIITSEDKKSVLLSTLKDNTIIAGEIKGMPVLTVFDKEEETHDVFDACGNGYELVNIGTQVWFKENLHCNKYDTESEAFAANFKEVNTVVGIADNNPYYTESTKAEYGYLFNWAAAMGYTANSPEIEGTGATFDNPRQGICPNGFHLPHGNDWATLKDFISDNVGRHLKTADGWNTETAGYVAGDNQSGFSALPAGYADGNTVYETGTNAYFWFSNASNSVQASEMLDGAEIPANASVAFVMKLSNTKDIADSGFDNKVFARSVRCLKD